MKLQNNLRKKFSKTELSELNKKIAKGKYPDFHTHDHFGSNMAQIYFVHNDQIFNCTVMSLKGDYMSIVSDRVHDKVKELYPKYYEFDFVPCEDRPGFSIMVRKNNYNEEEVREYEKELYETICDSKEFEVRERLVVDFTYEYGIGITVYADKDRITLALCRKVMNMVKEMEILYEGEYFLGLSTGYTYEEAKEHKLIGASLDIEEDDEFKATLGLDELEELE